MTQEEWEALTPAEEKEELYHRQMTLLEQFHERNAISEEQYQKSRHDLTEKMGMEL